MSDEKTAYIVRFIYGNEIETLGALKPSDHTLHELNHIQFRLNGKPIQINHIWANIITEAEYESYLEMNVLDSIHYGAEFSHPSGLNIKVISILS